MPFSRNELVNYLEGSGIATRLVFLGKIIRHPAFQNVKHHVYSELKNTDTVMEDTFWVRVYLGLSYEMIRHVLGQFDKFSEPRRYTA